MKKGYIGPKMIKRFSKIRLFIRKNKRFPTNFEMAKMFKVSVGESSKDIGDKYKRSLKCCVLCGKRK